MRRWRQTGPHRSVAALEKKPEPEPPKVVKAPKPAASAPPQDEDEDAEPDTGPAKGQSTRPVAKGH